MPDTPNLAERSARVLIVEDEAGFLRSLEMGLTHAGYAVATATTAEEGRRVFDAFHPDALVTDVKLPNGETGLAMARGLIAKYPDLPVIVMSGYMSDETMPTELEGAPFLSKPIGSLAIVRQLKALGVMPRLSAQIKRVRIPVIAEAGAPRD
jgi:DNA-binding NtrC family response regulator